MSKLDVLHFSYARPYWLNFHLESCAKNLKLYHFIKTLNIYLNVSLINRDIFA